MPAAKATMSSFRRTRPPESPVQRLRQRIVRMLCKYFEQPEGDAAYERRCRAAVPRLYGLLRKLERAPSSNAADLVAKAELAERLLLSAGPPMNDYDHVLRSVSQDVLLLLRDRAVGHDQATHRVIPAAHDASDQDLIEASAQFRRAIAKLNALPDDSSYEKASDALAVRMDALLEPMTRLHAATTEGQHARAAALWDYLDPEQRDPYQGYVTQRLCAAVLRDLLAQAPRDNFDMLAGEAE